MTIQAKSSVILLSQILGIFCLLFPLNSFGQDASEGVPLDEFTRQIYQVLTLADNKLKEEQIKLTFEKADLSLTISRTSSDSKGFNFFIVRSKSTSATDTFGSKFSIVRIDTTTDYLTKKKEITKELKEMPAKIDNQKGIVESTKKDLNEAKSNYKKYFDMELYSNYKTDVEMLDGIERLDIPGDGFKNIEIIKTKYPLLKNVDNTRLKSKLKDELKGMELLQTNMNAKLEEFSSANSNLQNLMKIEANDRVRLSKISMKIDSLDIAGKSLYQMISNSAKQLLKIQDIKDARYGAAPSIEVTYTFNIETIGNKGWSLAPLSFALGAVIGLAPQADIGKTNGMSAAHSLTLTFSNRYSK